MPLSLHEELHYLDTSVLLNIFRSYSQGGDAKKAHDYFKRIEDGTLKGIVSSLALAEVIHAVRKSCVHRKGVIEINMIEAELEKILTKLYQINNLVFFTSETVSAQGLCPEPPLFFPILDFALGQLKRSKYEVEFIEEKNEYKFRGLGINDCLHVRIASELGCDCIATFDKGFLIAEHEIRVFDVRNNVKR